ncbi:Rne/Rng family ribonuclease [Leucobacter massiliensis]|uniref:Ribonuclease E n=1 Tax=Leucobacter massiliensis TaxID=1686285 RepID=A0A2S9QQ92_9MICO|nr:Rne/Rng family ribonuclease [Leucobacter massiliensis]PRI11742.1 ribonuclease E/G [Leucobacter massiliensis]
MVKSTTAEQHEGDAFVPQQAEVVEGDGPAAEPSAVGASEDRPTVAEGSEPVSEETAAEAAADGAETAAEASEGSSSASQSLTTIPFAEMTPEERFRATTRLIFLAPDVPPVQPRPRRSDWRFSEPRQPEARAGESRRGEGRGGEFRGESQSGELRGGELRELDELLDKRFSRDEDAAEREPGSRRTRRRSGGAEGQGDGESARRQPRQAPVITEPQKVKGSTRLEAKKQRRRDGRDTGRRRMVITESEFLARREAVDREMIVRTTADRVQIGVLEDKVLVEHYVARSSESSLIGNVYLGRVQNVLPSMEAAFVDIGRGRNAVLYSGEVDWSEFEGGNTARKIENALKPGDQVLVQVTKDPVGHKGARLTSQISLPGRFLVYVPGGAMNGISRKLPDTERARLKKILKEVLPSGAGVIVRTAAEGASEEQLTHDVQRLTRQWESIQKRVEKGGGPVLLHSEPDMLIKIIRDVFNEDFQRLLISGDDTYRTIEEYLSQVAPDLLQRVERHAGERDVFDEYRITEQIAKALDRKVWLPSGGSLVIDRTEAMTVVDVNTGKFVGSGGNLEETVTKNNLEAAEEIVRQLRLRDIGGIIVIDFIDMVLESNRDLVLRRLVECLSRDRTKHQVAEVTSLGLVQMTRKKLGLGLLESFSEPCETCAGRGIIVHHEPVAKHHRSEGSSRGKGRGKGAQTQHEPKPQTHAISDGAKNMLAQVAASTIQSAGRAGEAGETPREAPVTGKVSRVPRERADTSSRREPESSGTLLDSVLDALPPAPAVGGGRGRGRRVSTPPMSGSGPVNDGSRGDAVPAAGAVDAAQEAQLALARALEETARRREAGRE